MSRVNFISASSAFHALYDSITLVLVYMLSCLIGSKFFPHLSFHSYVWMLIIAIPVWLFFMAVMRMYDKIMYFSYDKVIRIVSISSLFIIIINATMSTFVKDTLVSKTVFLIFSVLSLITMLMFEVTFKYLATREKSVLSREARVVIVGVPGITKKFINYITANNLNMNVIGYIETMSGKSQNEDSVLGTVDELSKIVRTHSIDEVVFALPKNYFGEVEKYVMQCEEMGLTVRMILDLYDLKIARTYLTNLGTLPMLTFDTIHFNRFQLLVKRSIDIVGSLIGLAITGVLAIFVAIAIKLDSPGPVIFVQNRVGLNGRTFLLYKFRSMCTDAEHLKKQLELQNEVEGGLMFKIKNDPRITKVGKFLRKTSLDEFPQFLNVLKGEMSLVGTRPPTVDEVSRYENYQRRRISIKPGLTGLWQVSGRSSITDFDDVVKLDTKYIDEWSIWMDLKIIVKTFMVVFGKDKGAY